MTMIGQNISHYNILEKLGEGGMGVVYKARDTKLDRDVALKFLPPHLAASDQDKARFVQEAKAAAALNHPNVCSIIDIQEHEAVGGSDKQMFIVMEFVDGQTLREKLTGSPQGMAISTKQAIDIGIQIADGLSTAHEKGIVHRDIKPENIMIRRDGIAQIMDFGLAKLRSSTMTKLTKAGSTIGTVGYMSPEQVQGQETDHRSDIFSLGVVLFELFTGSLPFKGMHETAVAYEIVNVDSPPMSSIRTDIPPELDAIVFDCLEKDPKERTQAASQVGLELKRYRRESSRNRASRITAARPIPSASSVGPPTSGVQAGGFQAGTSAIQEQVPVAGGENAAGKKSPNFVLMAIVALVAVAAGYFVSRFTGGSPEPADPMRVSIELPAGLAFVQRQGGHTVISPDGKWLAFTAVDSLRREMLWIRSISSNEPVRLSGTDGATYPFWSPDSRSIGFFTGGKLKRVDITGSPPLTIANAGSGRGGAWSSQGMIVFAPIINQQNLFKVPVSGGTPVAVTDHDTTTRVAPRFPYFLPDGEHFLYITMDLGGGTSDQRDDYRAWIGSLQGKSTELPLRGTSNIYYSSGHILYLRQSTFIAQPFDHETFAIMGDPIPLDKNVNFWPQRAKGDFSVTDGGTIVYGLKFLSGSGEILWVDREGQESTIIKVQPEFGIDLSPDSRKISYVETQEEDNNVDIWTYDIERGVRTRFTFHSAPDRAPIWSPDGSTVLFSSRRGSSVEIYGKGADGMSNAELVATREGVDQYTSDISSDARFILMTEFSDSTLGNITFADLTGGGKVQNLLETKYLEGFAKFSPDGKWIVYRSNESGRNEIYVRPFAGTGGKWQISTTGGTDPLWARSGEIFFKSGDMEMAVSVNLSGGRPTFSLPKPLFQVGGETQVRVVDVTPAGDRFLAVKTPTRDQGVSMSVIFNWPALTEKK